jgi:hypothetical protein
MLKGVSQKVPHKNPLLLETRSGIAGNLILGCLTRCQSAIRYCVSSNCRRISHEDPKKENGFVVLHGDAPATVRKSGGKQLSLPAPVREVMI